MKKNLIPIFDNLMAVVLAIFLAGSAFAGGSAGQTSQPQSDNYKTVEGVLAIKEGHGDFLVRMADGKAQRFSVRAGSGAVEITRNGEPAPYSELKPSDSTQVKYNATRRLVLRGVDGIVFVADAMAVRREKNLLSLKNLQENLSNYKKSIFRMPCVFQYNKIDLREQGIPLLPVETLEKDLNSRLRRPSFAASALTGTNVVATLKKIISMTVASIKKDLK